MVMLFYLWNIARFGSNLKSIMCYSTVYWMFCAAWMNILDQWGRNKLSLCGLYWCQKAGERLNTWLQLLFWGSRFRFLPLSFSSSFLDFKSIPVSSLSPSCMLFNQQQELCWGGKVVHVWKQCDCIVLLWGKRSQSEMQSLTLPTKRALVRVTVCSWMFVVAFRFHSMTA